MDTSGTGDITILYTTLATSDTGRSLSLGLRGNTYLIINGEAIMREITEERLISEVIQYMGAEMVPEWIELDAFISSYIDESKWVLAALERT